MTESDLVRRLTTIMDIDVVGFSTMSARDEEHALGLLGNRMAAAQALVRHHRGRVFKLTGDGLLAEFASPVEAVRAALEIQEAMRAANDQAGPNDQFVLRIGVNLGDVVESGDDLMGDAVNVAARLESIAKPGGICVSAAVYEQIEGKLTLGAEDLGEQHVKNIPRAIHAYRLTLGGAPAVAAAPANGRKTTRLAVIIGTAAVVALLAIGGAWLLHERSELPPSRMAQTPAPAPPAAPPAAAVPSPPPVAAPPAAAPAAAPPAPRPYIAAEVPFVPLWREQRLEDYALAENDKAMAINVRGWFATATRMLDETSARRQALEECNALVEREVPIVRDFDRCVIYAVG
ncbi:MAG TPA: adenylate/guanylate cyclase domain-containing protein, partial [Reyranella sp.]|nr:adenylate/guanylate cyclase domain-containing protein [Reyranella sp.]